MTLLDAARVGCAMDGMATDIHRGYAGGMVQGDGSLEPFRLKLTRENRPLEPKVLKLLIRALIAMSPWLFLNETGCYAIHGASGIRYFTYRPRDSCSIPVIPSCLPFTHSTPV